MNAIVGTSSLTHSGLFDPTRCITVFPSIGVLDNRSVTGWVSHGQFLRDDHRASKGLQAAIWENTRKTASFSPSLSHALIKMWRGTGRKGKSGEGNRLESTTPKILRLFVGLGTTTDN